MRSRLCLRTPLLALLAVAVLLPARGLLAQDYPEPYDAFKAMDDAYSYAETRRRYDIRRQIEWNDESRLRQGIPPKFDNTVSYVPLTVNSGVVYPPASPYGYGAAAPYGGMPYGYGGVPNGYGPGMPYGYPGGVPYGQGYAYKPNGFNWGTPIPNASPFPQAPQGLKARVGNAVRRFFHLPPKVYNDRAYLSLFPYYNSTPQSIGQKTVQTGPDRYESLPVYAPPKKAPAGASPATPPAGREF